MQLTNNLIYPWKFTAAPKKCVRFTDEKISKGRRWGMVKKVSRTSKKILKNFKKWNQFENYRCGDWFKMAAHLNLNNSFRLNLDNGKPLLNTKE